MKILTLAKIYFNLLALKDQPLSFTASYRIGRNLDFLKPIGERFSKELEEEFKKLLPEKPEASPQYYAGLADQAVTKRWEDSEEEEEMALKKLNLSGEDIKLSPAQIMALKPILEGLEDDE